MAVDDDVRLASIREEPWRRPYCPPVKRPRQQAKRVNVRAFLATALGAMVLGLVLGLLFVSIALR